MRLSKIRIGSLTLALLFGFGSVACQTDDGLFDRDEGTFEEMAEEVDDAVDRDRS